MPLEDIYIDIDKQMTASDFLLLVDLGKDIMSLTHMKYESSGSENYKRMMRQCI